MLGMQGFESAGAQAAKLKQRSPSGGLLGSKGQISPELITCFCLGAQELVAMITLVHPASTAIVIHTHTPPPYRTMVSESGWGNASLTPDH